VTSAHLRLRPFAHFVGIEAFRLFAVRANDADEALGRMQFKAGNEIVRLDAHVMNGDDVSTLLA